MSEKNKPERKGNTYFYPTAHILLEAGIINEESYSAIRKNVNFYTEISVFESFFDSITNKNGNYLKIKYHKPKNEPPDLVYFNDANKLIGVEVTELIHEETCKLNQRGNIDNLYYYEYSDDEILGKILNIINTKEEKVKNWTIEADIKILLIHTDEMVIDQLRVSTIFKDMISSSKFDYIYILFSYCPMIKLCPHLELFKKANSFEIT
jgi:hypothetical protein